MGVLYAAGESRETLAILMALTNLDFVRERLWRILGCPYWHGVNLDFKAMLGNRAREQSLLGDADIVGVAAINGKPDFNEMFAIEVKTLKFSLEGKLKGLGSKIEEAEAQADKLRRLGFAKTAILYVLTTENKPERDRGQSHGWWDAAGRGLAARDRFLPLVKDRARHHNVFVWPCGAHPSLGEDQAGAGAPEFLGGPSGSEGPVTDVIKANRRSLAEGLMKLILDLPRPPVWGQTPWPTVFGHCADCSGVVQYFWDGRLCKACGQGPV